MKKLPKEPRDGCFLKKMPNSSYPAHLRLRAARSSTIKLTEGFESLRVPALALGGGDPMLSGAKTRLCGSEMSLLDPLE